MFREERVLLRASLETDGAEFIEAKGEARCAGRRCRCGRATPDEARRQQSAKTAAWTDIASAIRTNLG